jgi:hypothetical protein
MSSIGPDAPNRAADISRAYDPDLGFCIGCGSSRPGEYRGERNNRADRLENVTTADFARTTCFH